MAYKAEQRMALPELESVRRFRESREGGPGSGPQGGKKSIMDLHKQLSAKGYVFKGKDHLGDRHYQHGKTGKWKKIYVGDEGNKIK